MKMEQSIPKRRHIKIQTPGNHPEESVQHSEHNKSLKYSNIFKPSHPSYLPAYEDGTEYSETSAYKNSDAGELPGRNRTTFITRRKFEIKDLYIFFEFDFFGTEYLFRCFVEAPVGTRIAAHCFNRSGE